MAARIERISAHDAHDHLQADSESLLVCAYEDDEKFAENHLDGALSLDEFEARSDSLPKDREIIFYCA